MATTDDRLDDIFTDVQRIEGKVDDLIRRVEEAEGKLPRFLRIEAAARAYLKAAELGDQVGPVRDELIAALDVPR